MNRRRVVKVPASSANLGPGFDVLAAALDLTLTLEVTETGTFGVETDLDVPTDKSNLIVRSFETLHPADDFHFRITSEIPLTGGLGSSASAILAGLAAADHIFELGVDLFEHAMQIEGHPDNIAAALNGGFISCASGGITRIAPPPGLEALVAVPADGKPVLTTDARAAMPAEVPLREVSETVGNAVNVVLGLERGDFGLLAQGLNDVIHQPRRAHLYPASAELMNRAAEDFGAIGATISGAGPSVLIWTSFENTGSVMEAAGNALGEHWSLHRASFTAQGLDVEV